MAQALAKSGVLLTDNLQSSGAMKTISKVDLALDSRAELAEGPAWDPDQQCLMWVDILVGRVHLFHPTKDVDKSISIGCTVGAALPRQDGRIALAIADGFGAMDPESGTWEVTTAVEAGQPAQRMNDAGVDPQGRLWAGTMSAGDPVEGSGKLYRLNGDGSVDVMLDRVTISNGIGWSPDGYTMYYVDSPTQRLDRFTYSPDEGGISNRQQLVEVPHAAGSPDGLAVDADGCIWVAVWFSSRLHRYTPDGKLDAVVDLPVSQPSSCAFGGPDLDVLYVTTARLGMTPQQLHSQPLAGGIFAVDTGVSGLPVPPVKT
jgi:sugar lactone lactonase YvrE